MPAIVTKSLIVPRWNSQDVVLLTPSTKASSLGQPVLNGDFTVDQSVISPLFDDTSSNPNVCLLDGLDLYVSVTALAAGIVKFPGYLRDPAASKSAAFVIDLSQNDYVGLAMDQQGNLYATAGIAYGNNSLYRFDGARAATGSLPGANLGNAGVGAAYLGNMVFDASGNLWATDYWNNRLVVFAASGLAGSGPAPWVALANPNPSVKSGFPDSVSYLFTSPEGIDFDAYGAGANLWVANNNDADEPGNFQNAAGTTLVEITPNLQAALIAQLAAHPNTTLTADKFAFNTDYFIFQAPVYGGGRPQFGGLQIDKSTGRLYVNDESTDGGSGYVRVYDSPAAVATASDSDSQLTPNNGTYAGNGGIALVGLASYIGDNSSDSGLEPNTAVEPPNPGWESPNIVATIVNQTGLTTLPTPAVDVAAGVGPDGSDTVLGNALRYIYVKVNNFSPSPTTGLDVLNLYWAKGNSSLGWQQPWDGMAGNDPAGGALGGPIPGGIGCAIPSIAPSGSVIVGPIPWNTPDPTRYESLDGHFCLLARIVTPNEYYEENSGSSPSDSSILAFAGMSFPEATGQPIDLNQNVANNARIAWRNIHIVASEPGGGSGSAGPYIVHPSSVVATNLGRFPLKLRVAFEALDADWRPVRHSAGPVRISAKGAAIALLERSSLGTLRAHESIPHLRSCELRDLATGIEGLHLKPGEMLAFQIEYLAPPGVRDFALRARVYAVEHGKERLMGGQTFVFGRVRGFGK